MQKKIPESQDPDVRAEGSWEARWVSTRRTNENGKHFTLKLSLVLGQAAAARVTGTGSHGKRKQGRTRKQPERSYSFSSRLEVFFLCPALVQPYAVIGNTEICFVQAQEG